MMIIAKNQRHSLRSGHWGAGGVLPNCHESDSVHNAVSFSLVAPSAKTSISGQHLNGLLNRLKTVIDALAAQCDERIGLFKGN